MVLRAFSLGARRGSHSPAASDHQGQIEPTSQASTAASSTSSVVAPAAAAAALTTAVWLEAPILAGSFLLATGALWWRNRRDGREQHQEVFHQNEAVLRPALCEADLLSAAEAEAHQLPIPGKQAATSVVVAEVVRLVRCFHVREALALAEQNGLLGQQPPPGGEPVEVEWLRQVAPRLTGALAGLSVPPPPAGDGGTWTGPLDSSGDHWRMSLWYRWSGPTMLSTVSRLEVPGTVAQSLSIFREADLIQHWVPFVSGCGNYPSEKLPAIIGTLRAKIPILPRSLNSLVCDAAFCRTPKAGRQGPKAWQSVSIPFFTFSLTRFT